MPAQRMPPAYRAIQIRGVVRLHYRRFALTNNYAGRPSLSGCRQAELSRSAANAPRYDLRTPRRPGSRPKGQYHPNKTTSASSSWPARTPTWPSATRTGTNAFSTASSPAPPQPDLDPRGLQPIPRHAATQRLAADSVRGSPDFAGPEHLRDRRSIDATATEF
jgi:hypothetical protein